MPRRFQRDCGTPDCTFLDRHDGLCSNQLDAGPRVRNPKRPASPEPQQIVVRPAPKAKRKAAAITIQSESARTEDFAGTSESKIAASGYKCSKCGQPKKGHVCNLYDPKANYVPPVCISRPPKASRKKSVMQVRKYRKSKTR